MSDATSRAVTRRAAASQDEPIRAAPPKPMDSRKRLRLCLTFMTAPDRFDDAVLRRRKTHRFHHRAWHGENDIDCSHPTNIMCWRQSRTPDAAASAAQNVRPGRKTS